MNFARRQECNKCGAPKPGDGGFGGGGECFRDVLLPEMFTGLENGPCSFSEKKPGSRNMFLSMAKLAKFLFFFFFLSLSLPILCPNPYCSIFMLIHLVMD